MTAARYWRLYCRQGGDGSRILAAEVELRTSAGGADQTGSGTASASAQNVGEEASKAFDNSTATYWQGNITNGAGWLKYDFGAGNDKDIVEFAMQALSGFASRMMKEIDVQSSPDDATWTTVWSVSQPTWTNAQQVFTKPTAANHRYWRLRPNTLQNGLQVMGAAELEMRSTSGGADQCTGGTALSRTAFSGFPASNAFDNSTATEWSGANAQANVVQSDWLGYDFGSGVTKDIVQLAYTNRTGTSERLQAPTAGWIESSSDGINWLSRWTFSGASYSGGLVTVLLSAAGTSSRRRMILSW